MSAPGKSTSTPKIEGYTFVEKVGSGSYSVVYKAVSKTGNRETVAVKCVEQSKLKGTAADNIITEIQLLKLLKHQYIVEMKDFLWDSKNIYIILEFCDGGDLSCFIKKRKRLSESICKKFLQQLAQAMKYLQDNNVCHMDLKPQNLLLSTKPQLTLKLAVDHQRVCEKVKLTLWFLIMSGGLCHGFKVVMNFMMKRKLDITDHRNLELLFRNIGSDGRLSTIRGSPLYMAPEMLLQGDYDASVDLWSIGIIMYECLFGRAPYSSRTFVELTDKIKLQKPIDIPKNSSISSECNDLLTRLLQHDPKMRISFADFFSHSFLDLEHIPSPESYEKGVQIVCDAVKFDKEKKYTDAFNLYCEALRYFVPIILAENDIRKKNALRSKINEYINRAENLKMIVYPASSITSQERELATNCSTHITSGSVFRELNLLCADDARIGEVLEMGCNAEQHYAERQYRLAFDKFQYCIRILLPFLTQEPPGRRRDLLLNQVKHWMQEAERTKALLSALDLDDANSVIEKGESCRLQ